MRQLEQRLFIYSNKPGTNTIRLDAGLVDETLRIAFSTHLDGVGCLT